MGEPIAEHGTLAGLCGWVGGKWEKVVIAGSHRLLVVIADQLVRLEVDIKNLPGDGLQLRRGNHVTAFYSDVPADTSGHILVSVAGIGVLEWITLGSNHSSSYFSVVVDTDVLYTVDVATPAVQGYIRPVYFQYGEKADSIFKLTCYDAANNRYGVALARPIWFNTSLVLNYGAGSVAAKVSIACGYHLA